MEQALFETTSAAMVFAYRYASQQHARAPSIDPTPRGNGKGLSGLDGAGEAAAILRKAGSLGKLKEAALRARFGIRAAECPCCGIEGPHADWLGMCRLLATDVVLVALPQLHEQMAVALVMRHFGWTGKTLEAIAEKYDTTVDRVKKINSRIGKALKAVESSAQAEISDLLIDAGLLPKVTQNT